MVPFDDAADPGHGEDSTEASARRDDAERGCPKCGHTETEVGSIATTGGGLSKFFDVQTNSFKVVTCTNCGYSELYRDRTSGANDIVDVFLG